VQIVVDLKEGLSKEIELVWGQFRWLQKIDYWRIPFRCFSCHQVGHVQEECSRVNSFFPPFKRTWKRKAPAGEQDSHRRLISSGDSSEIQAQGNISRLFHLKNLSPFLLLVLFLLKIQTIAPVSPMLG
jgi:hypothetical protein